MRSNLTTLCYIEKEGSYLMLHRVKKKADINKDKWIGVGGHFEEGESPEQCLLREVREETGLSLESWKLRGIITFSTDTYGTEYMFLYTAAADGEILADCDEGRLEWVEKPAVYDLPVWEGDKIFFRLLERRQDFFSLTLRYEGEGLAEVSLDGRDVDVEEVRRRDYIL